MIIIIIDFLAFTNFNQKLLLQFIIKLVIIYTH